MDEGFTIPVLVVDGWYLRDSASTLTDGYDITLCILREIVPNGDRSRCSIHVGCLGLMEWISVRDMIHC